LKLETSVSSPPGSCRKLMAENRQIISRLCCYRGDKKRSSVAKHKLDNLWRFPLDLKTKTRCPTEKLVINSSKIVSTTSERRLTSPLRFDQIFADTFAFPKDTKKVLATDN
jgi:hypothetical protein